MLRFPTAALTGPLGRLLSRHDRARPAANLVNERTAGAGITAAGGACRSGVDKDDRPGGADSAACREIVVPADVEEPRISSLE
jgi:hypothetical protein